MSRWIAADNQTAADQPTVQLVMLAFLDIPGDPIRVHDAVGTLTFGGNDYLGTGIYGDAGSVSETMDVIAQPVKLTLSGVDASLVADAMQTQYHGRSVILYIGLLNTATSAFVATPEIRWKGFMDVMTIEFNQTLATITLDCEHHLRRLNVSSRYTNEDQQSISPGDLGLSHTWEIPNFPGKWGARDISFSFNDRRTAPPWAPRHRPD